MKYFSLAAWFVVSSLGFVASGLGASDIDHLNQLDEAQLTAELADQQTSSAIYQAAQSAFEAEDYPQAIRHYQTLIRGDRAATSLYYNLGTAHFRNQSPGKAALWFRRAHYLSPHMPELKQNFEFLRRSQGIFEFAEQGWEKTLRNLSPTFLKWTATVFLWLTLTAILLLIIGKRIFRPIFVVSGLLSLVILVAHLWAIYFRANYLAPEIFATIVDTGSALTAPAPDSLTVVDLPAGSEVKIIQNTGPWIYAAIPGDFRGWIHHSIVNQNWPITEEIGLKEP